MKILQQSLLLISCMAIVMPAIANNRMTKKMQIAKINEIRNIANSCNLIEDQTSNTAYNCYETARKKLSNITISLDASNKDVEIINEGGPSYMATYKSCDGLYPVQLQTFFKAQVSKCKMGADIAFSHYAVAMVYYFPVDKE